MIFDPVSQIVMHNGKAARLSPMEFAIIKYMASIMPQRTTRQKLLDHVSGDYYTISVRVAVVRKKLQRIGLDIYYSGRKGFSLVEMPQ